MDDVLDCVRTLHIGGDFLRLFLLLLVSILLRDQDRVPDLAPVARHQGLLPPLPQVRPPAAAQPGAEDRRDDRGGADPELRHGDAARPAEREVRDGADHGPGGAGPGHHAGHHHDRHRLIRHQHAAAEV